MSERQFRREYRNDRHGEWLNVDSVLFAPMADHGKFGRVTGISFRDKPQFEPGFYQLRSDADIVRHFARPAPDFTLDEFLHSWRRVDVVPRDQE